MSAHNPYEGTTPIYVDHVEDAVEPDAEAVVETTADETDAQTPAEHQEEAQKPVANPVPVGSIKEILEWVGDDKERAAQALAAEVEGDNRKTLTKTLREILA